MIHTTNMCSSLCITYNALTTTYIYCKSISTQIQIASKTIYKGYNELVILERTKLTDWFGEIVYFVFVRTWCFPESSIFCNNNHAFEWVGDIFKIGLWIFKSFGD